MVLPTNLLVLANQAATVERKEVFESDHDRYVQLGISLQLGSLLSDCLFINLRRLRILSSPSWLVGNDLHLFLDLRGHKFSLTILFLQMVLNKLFVFVNGVLLLKSGASTGSRLRRSEIFLGHIQLNKCHVHVAHLVKQELSILSVMLC